MHFTIVSFYRPHFPNNNTVVIMQWKISLLGIVFSLRSQVTTAVGILWPHATRNFNHVTVHPISYYVIIFWMMKSYHYNSKITIHNIIR